MSALLLPNEIVALSSQAADLLVNAGDGDCALLYLALLRGGDLTRARQSLHWDETKLGAVYARLVKLGLAAQRDAAAPAPAQPREEPAQYTRRDIADALEREPEFCGVYHEVERLFGRPLSDADLHTLYTVYDDLALPAEVILMLVIHVQKTLQRQKQSDAVRARMSQVKSEAYRWKRMGLTTVDAAEAYLRRQQQVDEREWDVLSAVGVRERRPAVEREREYISSWVELGLSDELIAMAHDRTVYQKGQMNWPYANKILLAWHQAGWRTARQVEEGEKAAKRPAPRKTSGEQPDYQASAQRIRDNDRWLDEFLESEANKGR